MVFVYDLQSVAEQCGGKFRLTDLLFICCQQQCTVYFLCDVYLYVHIKTKNNK